MARVRVHDGNLVNERPSICACLIVRNEAQNLPRCLDSLGTVDELVIVDTGSTDNTVEIAESYGAKIGHFEWCDDFSAARNHALEMVTCDWVLSIDADEELRAAPGAFRDVFSKPANIALVSFVNPPPAIPAKIPRLFKKLPDTHWILRVHEIIEQSEPAFVDAANAIHLLHHGYTAELTPAKIQRNLCLSRLSSAENPNSFRALFYHAREAASAKEPVEGLTVARRLLTLPIEGNELSDAYAIAAWNASLVGDWLEVERLTTQARERRVWSVWTEFCRGIALMNLQRCAEALEAAERACQLPMPDWSGVCLDEIAQKRFMLRDRLRQEASLPSGS
jgi:hypothetical protein